MGKDNAKSGIPVKILSPRLPFTLTHNRREEPVLVDRTSAEVVLKNTVREKKRRESEADGSNAVFGYSKVETKDKLRLNNRP